MMSLSGHGLEDRDSFSAVVDRVLVQLAVRDPKAPCSELRQQWQNLNVRANTRTVNRRLNRAGLNARRPRRRTFLTPDHRAVVCSRPLTYFLELNNVRPYLLIRRQLFSITIYGWACTCLASTWTGPISR